MTLRHFALAVLVTVIWGLNVVVTKWGVGMMPPVFFAGLRFFVVAILLAPWLRPVPGQMRRVVAIGLTSGALHFGLILVGYSLTAHAAPIAVALQFNIPFMVLLAVIFLGEKVGPWGLIGMAIAFGGILVLGFDPVAFDDPMALVLVCTGSCFFAVSVILMRGLTGAHPMQIQAWIAAVSFPALFAVSALTETGQITHALDSGWMGLAAVAYTGIGASIIGHGGMFYLLQRYPVTTMVPFMIAPPMLGMFFSIWIYQDPVTTKLAIGGLMTFSGVAIIQIREALEVTARTHNGEYRMITDRQSPNFSARPPGFDIDLLILHYTGMGSSQAAIDRLCDPEAKVSSHYLIDEDGTVHQLVTEDKTAWHAGQSCWEGKIGMNQRSVGIELVNPGHENGYRDFPEAQLAALEALSLEVLSRHPIPRRQVLGHSDIAPMRKDDPGELFPWERFGKKGIGLWPQHVEMEPVAATIRDVQNALRSVGYCIPVDGQDSPVYRAILKAFQRHWRPKKVDGSADKDTRTMIAAVQVAVQADMAATPPKGGVCDH